MIAVDGNWEEISALVKHGHDSCSRCWGLLHCCIWIEGPMPQRVAQLQSLPVPAVLQLICSSSGYGN